MTSRRSSVYSTLDDVSGTWSKGFCLLYKPFQEEKQHHGTANGPGRRGRSVFSDEDSDHTQASWTNGAGADAACCRAGLRQDGRDTSPGDRGLDLTYG